MIYFQPLHVQVDTTCSTRHLLPIAGWISLPKRIGFLIDDRPSWYHQMTCGLPQYAAKQKGINKTRDTWPKEFMTTELHRCLQPTAKFATIIQKAITNLTLGFKPKHIAETN